MKTEIERGKLLTSCEHEAIACLAGMLEDLQQARAEERRLQAVREYVTMLRHAIPRGQCKWLDKIETLISD